MSKARDNTHKRKLHLKRYQIQKKQGEGTFGEVYKCIDTHDNSVVALKSLKDEQQCDCNDMPPLTLREICIQKQLKHPNIVAIKRWHIQNYCLVFEFCDTDQHKYMKNYKENNNKLIPIKEIKGIMRQIFKALDYCHQLGIMHRDLKPMNIQMKNSGKVKVADFGLARTLHQPVRTYTSEIMTLYYKPPEQLFNDKHYANYVDVWSAGCILGEMLRGKHIFSGECELDLVFDIFRKLGIPEEGLTRSIYSNQSPGFWSKIPKFSTAKLNDQQAQLPDRFDDEALDQLRLLQDVHPTKRIPPCQAQQHPWLKED